MDVNLRRLSQIMAQALRHRPERFGIELDTEGWTAVSDLLAGLHHRSPWMELTEADIQAALALSGKRRYEMQDGRIRALYGHSKRVEVRKETAVPPDTLYHGTEPETAVIILREGLKPMKRQFVHLSTDIEIAKIVGGRKNRQPVVLKVAAAAAYEQGIPFYQGNETTWLAEFVPSDFVKPFSEETI
ncbi:MAG: RNA 2'-phosphotransferase [Chloroflexi bacterium]|nr:RNA 2'-phosphotransferase [Chloroflexota bacterium]